MNDMVESRTELAGYLAIHYHKRNLAMMFVNPSVKIRLLLSCVLIGARQEAHTITQCMYHRSIISECHLRAKEIIEQYKRGELSGDLVEQIAATYAKKAALSHSKIMELSSAQN